MKGGVGDEEAVAELLEGADVVLSFLGMVDPKLGPVVRPGVEHIIAGLKKVAAGGEIIDTSVPPSLTYPLPRRRPGPQAGLDVGDGYRGLQGPDAGLQLAHGQTHAQPHHPLHAQGDGDTLQVDEDEY